MRFVPTMTRSEIGHSRLIGSIRSLQAPLLLTLDLPPHKARFSLEGLQPPLRDLRRPGSGTIRHSVRFCTHPSAACGSFFVWMQKVRRRAGPFPRQWVGLAGGPVEKGDGSFRLVDHLPIRPARQRLFS